MTLQRKRRLRASAPVCATRVLHRAILLPPCHAPPSPACPRKERHSLMSVDSTSPSPQRGESVWTLAGSRAARARCRGRRCGRGGALRRRPPQRDARRALGAPQLERAHAGAPPPPVFCCQSCLPHTVQFRRVTRRGETLTPPTFGIRSGGALKKVAPLRADIDRQFRGVACRFGSDGLPAMVGMLHCRSFAGARRRQFVKVEVRFPTPTHGSRRAFVHDLSLPAPSARRQALQAVALRLQRGPEHALSHALSG